VTVCVHGPGYVGLVTTSLFAREGRGVVGSDADPEVLADFRRGSPTSTPNGSVTCSRPRWSSTLSASPTSTGGPTTAAGPSVSDRPSPSSSDATVRPGYDAYNDE